MSNQGIHNTDNNQKITEIFVPGGEDEFEFVKFLRDIVRTQLKSIGVRYIPERDFRAWPGGYPGTYRGFFLPKEAPWIKEPVSDNLDASIVKYNNETETLIVYVCVPLGEPPNMANANLFIETLLFNVNTIAAYGLKKIGEDILGKLRENEIKVDERYTLIPKGAEVLLSSIHTKSFPQGVSVVTDAVNTFILIDIVDNELYRPPDETGRGGAKYEKIKEETKVGKKNTTKY